MKYKEGNQKRLSTKIYYLYTNTVFIEKKMEIQMRYSSMQMRREEQGMGVHSDSQLRELGIRFKNHWIWICSLIQHWLGEVM